MTHLRVPVVSWHPEFSEPEERSVEAVCLEAAKPIQMAWSRLPIPVRVILKAHGEPPPVWLCWLPGYGSMGWTEYGAAVVNAAAGAGTPDWDASMIWSTARAFCDLFVHELGKLAATASDRDDSQLRAGASRTAALAGFLCQSHRAPYMYRDIDANMKLVEAMTVAWGFGLEYAACIRIREAEHYEQNEMPALDEEIQRLADALISTPSKER